jgi:hypothetical protein
MGTSARALRRFRQNPQSSSGSAAKAFHQREHHAQAGKDREDGGGEDQLNGVELAGLHRRAQQGHGIVGQKLLKSAAHLAHQRGSLRRLSQQRAEDNQRRKQSQHTGICDGFGRVKHVMLKCQQDSFANAANRQRHRAL